MYASHRFAKFAASALVAGGLGLAAVATAGTAGAISSTDDTFLAEITAEGISYDSPKDAIYAAHDVCFALDDGADPVDLGMEILDEHRPDHRSGRRLRARLGGHLLPRARLGLRIDPSPRGGPAAAAGPPHHHLPTNPTHPAAVPCI